MLAKELNRRLATERLVRGRGLERAGDRIPWNASLATLPVGTVILHPDEDTAHLVTAHHLQPFSFDGWGPTADRPRHTRVQVLTPPTSVAALANGFVPRLHPTAASDTI